MEGSTINIPQADRYDKDVEDIKIKELEELKKKYNDYIYRLKAKSKEIESRQKQPNQEQFEEQNKNYNEHLKIITDLINKSEKDIIEIDLKIREIEVEKILKSAKKLEAEYRSISGEMERLTKLK